MIGATVPIDFHRQTQNHCDPQPTPDLNPSDTRFYV